jgi:ParB family chromosome partitioning protein
VAEPVRKNTGLGKGLGALLSVVPREDGTQEQLKTLPVSSIVPNPRQPRRKFNEKALDALSGSIGERGVLQPVLVRSIGGGKWELIAGERRWRAAQTAGLTEIPAVIRNDDDAVALEVALIENMAREDLSPIEEAKACAALVDELRELGLYRLAVRAPISVIECKRVHGRGRSTLKSLQAAAEGNAKSIKHHQAENR